MRGEAVQQQSEMDSGASLLKMYWGAFFVLLFFSPCILADSSTKEVTFIASKDHDTSHAYQMEHYKEDIVLEKSERVFLYEKIKELEAKIDYLYSEKGLLERLLAVFANPPGYIESFLSNLSKRMYDTRELARRIKKWTF